MILNKKLTEGLVSVCIPTYNGSKYIRDTIESVLNQSYQNFEIIIHDDCSDDDTLNIINGYHDDRIRCYTSNKRSGLASNWNETVRHANGQFTKLLCQDDLLYKQALEVQVGSMCKNDSILCSIGNTKVINSCGKIIMTRKRFLKSEIKNGIKFAKKSLRGRNIYCEPGNLLYRTQLFYQYGPYDKDLKYNPDWEFAMRISSSGSISCEKEYIMSFRVSDSSETSHLYKQETSKIISDMEKMFYIYKNKKEYRLNLFNELYFKTLVRLYFIMRYTVIVLNNWRNHKNFSKSGFEVKENANEKVLK